MEYWNDGLREMKTKVLFFPTIPLLHHSITPYGLFHHSHSPKDHTQEQRSSPRKTGNSGGDFFLKKVLKNVLKNLLIWYNWVELGKGGPARWKI